jgi:hypothetical protein
MLWKVVIVAIAAVAVSFVSVNVVGRGVWRSRTVELRRELIAAARQPAPTTFQQSKLEGAPELVKKYLAQVLAAGRSTIASARISHSGTFNMGTSEPRWRPFSSTQDVVVSRPGFLWNAHIGMAPGMPARVHDAYVNGRAVLTARLFGLFTVMESPDSPELAQGELIRFLAEAPWYPTALLPGPNLSWAPVDDHSARLTLTDGGTEVSLQVRFNEDGLIESVYTDGRYREVDGTQTKVPWEGRFWNYEEREGMMIPLDGEVAWLLPEGRWPYWRGHIEEIHYELGR